MPSALTKTTQGGQGSAAHGGCCASLGHKFGFGNTLDLGCKERGHKSQGPLVHATGKGWVKEHKGQYYDALHVKNGIVKICLVESQCGCDEAVMRMCARLYSKHVRLGPLFLRSLVPLQTASAMEFPS